MSPQPKPTIGSVRAIVRIQTPPEFNPLTGEIDPARFIGFDTASDESQLNRDLLSISTSKKLEEPCGRATLEFTPQKYRGRTWADMIPSYSLIEIFLQRYPEDPQPVLVFLGLTDARSTSETYHASGSLERHVTVSARELSCILVDWRTLYLPSPPENLLRDSTTKLPSLFREEVQLLGMLALDPELALVGEDPVTVIGKFVKMLTTGLKTPYNKTGMPLVNLQLPHDDKLERPRSLTDYLVFDEDRARRDLFDPTAQLPASSQFTLSDHSLWNLVDTFRDPVYQELFTQTVDANSLSSQPLVPIDQQTPRRDAGYVEVVFRKRPFGGRLDASGDFDQDSIRRDPGESQFDRDFERDPTNTFEVSDQDVTGLEVHQSPQNLINLYYVFPQVPNINGIDWQSMFPPLVDDGDGAPSSIVRYGLRMLKHPDYYFGEVGKDVPGDIERGRSRARMLYYWYRYNPLFFEGHYTIKGNPLARVGTRMVHSGRDFGPEGVPGQREYYVTSVAHQMKFSDEVRFSTSVEVERGWPIYG